MDDNQFASIDRLIDFGLSLGIAQQMAASMNAALRNTHVSGSQTPMVGAPSVSYYVLLDQQQAGPLAPHELGQLINSGRVTKDTLVWRPGMAAWQQAANVPDVLRLVALAVPPVPTPPPLPSGEPV